MKLYILPVLLMGFLGSCTNNAPPPNVPPPPVKTESALPGIGKVDGGVTATIDITAKLGAKIEDQKQTIVEQRSTINEAISQIDKLKVKLQAKEIISEPELNDLMAELKKLDTKNNFLETQNKELTTFKEEQEKTLAEIRIALSKTKEQVVSKENETENLRVQNKYLADNLTTYGKEAEKLKQEITKQKQNAARANVYRNWVIGLSVGFILWTIIKNLLMIYLPAMKFRI